MMTVMRAKSNRSSVQDRKEATHERIVDVAARAIRRSGYDGTGVADIMKEAGLTHGGFYAHFASRDALLAEAGDRAGAESVALAASIAAAAPAGEALQRIVEAYLSDDHLAAIETGCPIAALGSEMPRQAPEVRRAATIRIKEMIDLLARQMPDDGYLSLGAAETVVGLTDAFAPVPDRRGLYGPNAAARNASPAGNIARFALKA